VSFSHGLSDNFYIKIGGEEPVREAAPILEAIRSTSAKIGLELQPLKCGYLFIRDGEEQVAHIRINGSELPQMKMERGVDLLGVPVGTPDAVDHIAQIYLDEILAYADKILSNEGVFAQDALLLLQYCVLTKETHMLRYGDVPPRILRDFDS